MTDPTRSTASSGPRRPPGLRKDPSEKESAERLEQEYAEAARRKLGEQKKLAVEPEGVPEKDLEQKKLRPVPGPVPEKEKTAPMPGPIREKKKQAAMPGPSPDLTIYVFSDLAERGVAGSLEWYMYCDRGWIASLMPTVTMTAKVECDGISFTIAQDAHRGGACGGAWIQKVKGTAVNPGSLPRKWKEAVDSALRGATAEGFEQQIEFSDHLLSVGGRPGKDALPEAILLNRWRTLRAKFGDEEVAKAPGGKAAITGLHGERVDKGRVYKPLN